MGRPELYPIKKVIGFDEPMLAAIDKWRREQSPIPSASDAIRTLIRKGLAPHKAKIPRRKRASAK
jgi:hypothetical protein